MNRSFTFLAMLLFSISAFTQKIDQNNVPAVILNSFHLKFPNAKEAEWKMDGGFYKIAYEVNGKSHNLKMDSRGSILEHSQDLYVSEIPKSVLKTIRDRAVYFDVNDADRYERDSRITYEVKFKIDGKYQFFWVNEKGKLLKYRKELKDSEVPKLIVDVITNNHGQIDIDYSKYVEEGNKNIYIIRGEINDSDYNFTIDDKGKILKYTQDLKQAEIPQAILNTLSSDYKDYDIRDADLKKENGKATYVLRIRKSKDQMYVTFGENGKVLKVKKR
ncbi:PepSY-like domain-containing protein [Aurantibacter crassamenti]|uniref:PepSY-like domain-containing protein n=1 Tax=Aurantibacter crassamenti TaxID=1837375 RepID=UPI00193A8BF0|nr:PepSY-like domain-containing protein [Aurantibacter crassamenti]MBM1105847.1 PepSY-like domain-containing protein [Aurantibacter crassamenti]